MLENVLSDAEYRSVPGDILTKIERILNENSENYVTTKALFETFKRDHGKIHI